MSIEIDFWYLISEIDDEMRRIGWDVEQGKRYLRAKYGTHTRFRLADQQLLEFWDYLKSLPVKQQSRFKLRGLKKY